MIFFWSAVAATQLWISARLLMFSEFALQIQSKVAAAAFQKFVF